MQQSLPWIASANPWEALYYLTNLLSQYAIGIQKHLHAQYILHRAPAALLHQNLLPFDEALLQALVVMPNGEQLQVVVIHDFE